MFKKLITEYPDDTGAAYWWYKMPRLDISKPIGVVEIGNMRGLQRIPVEHQYCV